MAVPWTTRCRWNTTYSADSVEWCPLEQFSDVMVCGTYQLDQTDGAKKETKQKRLGRIYLFQVNDETTDLSPSFTIDTSGILDQKWCYHRIDNHPVLAVVTSNGCIKLYRLIEDSGSLKLELWIEESLGEDVLALSVDWSTNKLWTEEPRLVVSDSLGSVTLFRVQDKLEKIGTWKAHRYEAWIGAFNYWNPDVFYSGGDDCAFKTYDVRVPEVAVTTNRSHEAGVTSVRSHIEEEHQLLTGSYDEKVRLWDPRNLKRPVSETNVRGGVWRLKWHPYKHHTVLAACMYGGFRVLKLDGEDMTIISEYLEHESIAYGADWKNCDKSTVGTCSFYDCKLHVGEVEL